MAEPLQDIALTMRFNKIYFQQKMNRYLSLMFIAAALFCLLTQVVHAEGRGESSDGKNSSNGPDITWKNDNDIIAQAESNRAAKALISHEKIKLMLEDQSGTGCRSGSFYCAFKKEQEAYDEIAND